MSVPNFLHRLRTGGLARRVRIATLPAVERREAELKQTQRRTIIQLLLQFESIGENCEVGFVQEHLGAEPLGLFRWSGVSLPHLLTALHTDLAGIGDKENTRIDIIPDSREYFVTDLRYGMTTHTSTFEHDGVADKVLDRFCRRTRFLRDKFLEDLAASAKILVFQSAKPLTEDERLSLLAALRRIGPSAELLCVQPARAGEEVGSVQRLAPGLMLGLIDRPGLDGYVWTISYHLWLTLFARALRLCGKDANIDVPVALMPGMPLGSDREMTPSC